MHVNEHLHVNMPDYSLWIISIPSSPGTRPADTHHQEEQRTCFSIYTNGESEPAKFVFFPVCALIKHFSLSEDRHTHTHTPDRWTVSGSTVALVSTLRPQQPPPSSVLWVPPSCSEAPWVECALPAVFLILDGLSGDYSGFQLSSIRSVWAAGRRCLP